MTEKLLLQYFGTLPAGTPPLSPNFQHLSLSNTSKNISCTLEDEEDRAVMYIAGKTQNRWGFIGDEMVLVNPSVRSISLEIKLNCTCSKTDMGKIHKLKLGNTKESTLLTYFNATVPVN